MKTLFLLLLSILLTQEKGISQTKSDTTFNYESAKYLLLAEQKTFNIDGFKKNILPNISIRQLKSNGFEHITFLLMEYRGFKKDSNMLASEFKENNIPHSCDFVIAVYGGIYFRIKGFINNDFYQFIEYYSENSDEGFVLKQKVFSKSTLKSFKYLTRQNNIYIEDIDLGCYFKYYSALKKLEKSLGNNFCSQSCIYNIKKAFLSN